MLQRDCQNSGGSSNILENTGGTVFTTNYKFCKELEESSKVFQHTE